MAKTSSRSAEGRVAHPALAAVVLGLWASIAAAQSPNRWGYTFDDSYDAIKAAPQVHRLKYEDSHIEFLEVANPPGYHMQMHGHPYPSVFARSSSGAIVNELAPKERFLDPTSELNGQHWRNGPAPQGLKFPTCTASDPQAPHLPFNGTDTPLHFYRIEFKRLDQDNLGVLQALYAKASPEQVRYEDAAVRLVEVTLLPGKSGGTTPNPYPAVLAFDTQSAFDALSTAAGATAGHSEAPAGMAVPRCMTIAPQTLSLMTNRGAQSLHYYRIDFKRIDGADLHDHWREWYPYMTNMP